MLARGAAINYSPCVVSSGALAIRAFTRIFDALWRNPPSVPARSFSARIDYLLGSSAGFTYVSAKGP